MCGQEGLYGTSAFQVVLDMEKMRKEVEIEPKQLDIEKEIETMGLEKTNCSVENIVIENHIDNIKSIPRKKSGYVAF
jgi:hypothetical protein